jgi:hypothetical protein
MIADIHIGSSSRWGRCSSAWRIMDRLGFGTLENRALNHRLQKSDKGSPLSGQQTLQACKRSWRALQETRCTERRAWQKRRLLQRTRHLEEALRAGSVAKSRAMVRRARTRIADTQPLV